MFTYYPNVYNVIIKFNYPVFVYILNYYRVVKENTKWQMNQDK